MTGAPEAAIARELGICYTSIAVVTDHDAGVEGAGVTEDEVYRVFGESIGRLQHLLRDVIAKLPSTDCTCRGSAA
jgi:5'-methylthioadenosine phosphorylase